MIRMKQPSDSSHRARPDPLFEPGQLVRHKRYEYRAVIVDVDPRCMASDQWYKNNQTQPDRAQPWYHVLVDGSANVTYPAQENLEPDLTGLPVDHPLIDHFFDGFHHGRYLRNGEPWVI